jgi:hypothetical protein
VSNVIVAFFLAVLFLTIMVLTFVAGFRYGRDTCGSNRCANYRDSSSE